MGWEGHLSCNSLCSQRSAPKWASSLLPAEQTYEHHYTLDQVVSQIFFIQGTWEGFPGGSGKATCQCRRHGFYCPEDVTWGGAAKLCATAVEPVLWSPCAATREPRSAPRESLCSNGHPALSKVKTGEGTWDLLTCCPFCVFALLMKQ